MKSVIPSKNASDVQSISAKQSGHKTLRQSSTRKRKRAEPCSKSTRGLDQHHDGEGNILKGMILAVSTHHGGCESSVHREEEREFSYNMVAKWCRQAGAMVSGQVHRRVQYLICTPSAVQQATQRVRKAMKQGIPLIEASWVKQCILEKQKVDMTRYRMEGDVQTHSKSSPSENTEDHTVPDRVCQTQHIPEITVDLGCCCVCHENGTDDCPWCVACTINQKAHEIQKKQV